MGRSYKASLSGLRCDLQAPNHNNLILPGKPYFRVTTGIAQGQYHSAQCYAVARKQYEALQNKMKLDQEARDEL